MTNSVIKSKGRGGPKTPSGKKIVSANARKASIFTQGYLPDEDVTGKQERLQAMVDQWQAYDPSRQLLLRTVEQAELGIERMMKAERIKIEGIMASVNISKEFCMRAGIELILAHDLPTWYFSEDEEAQTEKQNAINMAIVWAQAHELKENYSDALMAQVATQYPELYEYVAEGFKPGYSFSSMLGTRYKQTTPSLNLAILMNKILEQKHHLRWSTHATRYQKIIDGLKAEKILEALDLDKSSRYATTFQNRILKAFAGLAAIDQHESQVNHDNTHLELNHELQDTKDQSVEFVEVSEIDETQESKI